MITILQIAKKQYRIVMQDKIFKVKVFEVTHKSMKYDVKIVSLLGYTVFVMLYLLVVFGRSL